MQQRSPQDGPCGCAELRATWGPRTWPPVTCDIQSMLTFIFMAVKTQNADFQKNSFAIDLELVEFNFPGESVVLSGNQSSLSSGWVTLFRALVGQRGPC